MSAIKSVSKRMDSMGWGLVPLLALSMFLIGCTAQMAPPVAYNTSYEGVPVGTAAQSATAGNRSGEAAVSRRSIDSMLNNPNRSAMPWNSPATPPAKSRPGLGTGWGRSVRSELGYTSYNRASTKPHQGFSTIYYNDREGVNAMTGWKSSASRMQTAAGGLAEWGVISGSSLLRNYYGNGRRFVVGKEDKTYTLVVKNLAKSRLEFVLSVDGLDVMDGKPASTKKRGYIVNSGETLKVKGWRTSSGTVASFKFSGVADSYTNLRHGETRNVGVMGLAVFTEKGVDPWTWMPHEVQNRKTASPFAEAPMYGVR